MTASLDLFERLLDGRDYLFGGFSAADCAAFPFLKYALDRNGDDDEAFHEILREYLVVDAAPARGRLDPTRRRAAARLDPASQVDEARDRCEEDQRAEAEQPEAHPWRGELGAEAEEKERRP